MLLLGKNYTKNDTQKIGGVITLFELFKKELNKNNVYFDVIDLNWRNYSNIIVAYIEIIIKIIFQTLKHNHISFHGTANEYAYLAPLVVFWGKLNGKKVSLRKFAGNFIEIFEASNYLKKRLFCYALSKSSINFFETKYLVKYFKKYNTNTYWFPNVRKKSTVIRDKLRPFQGRFIFLGHIIPGKGIDEILQASQLMPANYLIELVGPIGNAKYNDELFKNYTNIKYKGIADPKQIQQTLSQYDVLLLPSYREGYPGVIIEAFSVGLPVIATGLKGIKEIVTHKKNGYLIEPKNVNQLKEAILFFNKENYYQFSLEAKNSFSNTFDSSVQTKEFLERIGFI